jgi:hypothetical protein
MGPNATTDGQGTSQGGNNPGNIQGNSFGNTQGNNNNPGNTQKNNRGNTVFSNSTGGSQQSSPTHFSQNPSPTIIPQPDPPQQHIETPTSQPQKTATQNISKNPRENSDLSSSTSNTTSLNTSNTAANTTTNVTHNSNSLVSVPVLFRWNHGFCLCLFVLIIYIFRATNSVYVSGSFNKWQNKIALQSQHQSSDEKGPTAEDIRNSSMSPETLKLVTDDLEKTNTTNQWIKTWSLTMSMHPGMYYFKYIVDGQWRHDPQEKNGTDHRGTMVNILTVNAPSPSTRPQSASIKQSSTTTTNTINTNTLTSLTTNTTVSTVNTNITADTINTNTLTSLTTNTTLSTGITTLNPSVGTSGNTAASSVNNSLAAQSTISSVDTAMSAEEKSSEANNNQGEQSNTSNANEAQQQHQPAASSTTTTPQQAPQGGQQVANPLLASSTSQQGIQAISEAYGQIVPSYQHVAQPPHLLPPHLNTILLARERNRSADPHLLTLVDHVLYNHLFVSSQRKNLKSISFTTQFNSIPIQSSSPPAKSEFVFNPAIIGSSQMMTMSQRFRRKTATVVLYSAPPRPKDVESRMGDRAAFYLEMIVKNKKEKEKEKKEAQIEEK